MQLAVKHADCLLTLPDAPGVLAERVRPVLDGGKEVGLLVSLIARETRAEALVATRDLLARVSDRARKTHREFSARSDSVTFTSMIGKAESPDSWVTPTLWTGAVPYLGAPSVAIVGDYDEVAATLWDFRAVGVSQFLFLGWPDLEEMTRFTEHVLPRLRHREGAAPRGRTAHEAPIPVADVGLPFLCAGRVEKGLQSVGHLADLLDRPTDCLRRPIQVQDQACPQAIGGLQSIGPLGDHPRLVVDPLDFPANGEHGVRSGRSPFAGKSVTVDVTFRTKPRIAAEHHATVPLLIHGPVNSPTLAADGSGSCRTMTTGG